MRTFVLTVLVALCAFGQSAPAPSPLDSVTLPPYVMVGVAYNQFVGVTGVVSALIPESDKVGIYGSITADVSATKIIDPITKKVGYGLSPSFRIGQHKQLTDAKNPNVLAVGGDFGPSFSQNGAQPNGGFQIGLSGSFTLTYIRQISTHWAVGVPVRMLWMSGVGPNGSGVWNPVVEVMGIYKK